MLDPRFRHHRTQHTHTSLTNHMLTISSVFRTCQAVIGWNQQQRFEVTKFAVHPLDSVGYANRNAKMEIIHAAHVFVKSVLFLLLWSKCEGRDSDLNYVTCGSLVKLLNTRHNVRLHSHDVKYGSGNSTMLHSETTSLAFPQQQLRRNVFLSKCNC